MSNGKDSTAMEPLAGSRLGIDSSEILENLSATEDEHESLGYQLCGGISAPPNIKLLMAINVRLLSNSH
ncbi:hypothetical protein Tcan_06183 [Toxocara canis]|uniref:Uncharacterized protein n=1 Tax=Toxocara canis TaxID=6265 RepID=A0A0B2VDP7_TOXCA|nr:hypothetical protein Tcan_06183 [Toxocara canis]